MPSPLFFSRKIVSCVLLLFFSVAATICTEASKLENGTYPYNTYVIPFAVEVLKLAIALGMLAFEQRSGKTSMPFSARSFILYSVPAFCYFVSNNCMFHIIQHLGASTFQITNNLKVLSTGVFMNIFLGKRLTWMQWKALVILTIGSMVTQLSGKTDQGSGGDNVSSLYIGYSLVILSAVASSAGGVFSEMLLKSKTAIEGKKERQLEVSIHFQNAQLYAFGVIFGLISLRTGPLGVLGLSNAFNGFNACAYATVGTLAVSGLLVSFILKYLDNVAKCFCAAISMLCVAILDAATRRAAIPLRIVLGIILTGLALEQYNLS